jgi:hypothetical protein
MTPLGRRLARLEATRAWLSDAPMTDADFMAGRWPPQLSLEALVLASYQLETDGAER